MARPHLSKLDSWGNHEARVLKVFELALRLLREEDDLPPKEEAINRKLYFCIHRANRQLNDPLSGPPVYDGKNAPDASDEVRTQREDKRPDFVCSFYDYQEPDPERSAKHYVVECKRLGMPSGSWKFNSNYVIHGICRFVNPEWGYGKSSKTAAMVGYVQSMELDDILTEVNGKIRDMQLPKISLFAEGWKKRDVTTLNQSLRRSKILPKAFRLRHIWLDVRDRYRESFG